MNKLGKIKTLFDDGRETAESANAATMDSVSAGTRQAAWPGSSGNGETRRVVADNYVQGCNSSRTSGALSRY